MDIIQLSWYTCIDKLLMSSMYLVASDWPKQLSYKLPDFPLFQYSIHDSMDRNMKS